MKRDYAENPPGQKGRAVQCVSCGMALDEGESLCPGCGAARKPKMAERLETK